MTVGTRLRQVKKLDRGHLLHQIYSAVRGKVESGIIKVNSVVFCSPHISLPAFGRVVIHVVSDICGNSMIDFCLGI